MASSPIRAFEHRHITVPRTARYAVMGSFDAELSEVWIICHGQGQLAARFLSRFKPLERDDRLFIAPEALSRYYLNPPSTAQRALDSPIGAIWMTREDRDAEIADQARYLDLVYEEVFTAIDRARVRLWVVGFSQGVATVARWVARGKIAPDRVVLWAGMIPPELDANAARALYARAPLTVVIGSSDEFATPKILALQEVRLRELGVAFRTQHFEGGHDIIDAPLLELAASDA